MALIPEGKTLMSVTKYQCGYSQDCAIQRALVETN